VAKRTWSVEFHPSCEAWANGLEQQDAEPLVAAIRVLRDAGPTLGRPFVDTIKGSRHANMKELPARINGSDRNQSSLRI
jgi:hypothetical protein